MDTSTKVNWLKLLQYTVLLGIVLYVGRSLFVPLSFALLISFVLYPICRWLELRGIPRWGAISVCLLVLLILFGGLTWLLVNQLMRLVEEWPNLQQKLLAALQDISAHLEQQFNLKVARQVNWLESMGNNIAANLLSMIQSLLYTSVVSVVLLVLIPLYVVLILYNREQLARALFSLFYRTEHHKIKTILQETITTYYNFIKGMAIVYAIVGTLNTIGLLIIGVPHALFFGVVASILTFIPYVGITIGAILPMAVAWITYDSAWYPLGVVIVFAAVQYLEANLIFPWAVSYRLQVNMLFTLLAIVAGGILWGASGMILFIPFLAILKLIADKHEHMRPISLLLGSDNS
ncbi:AI-2E family transporter [Pontibacter sp. KCTC 32443]|uniref:AI-2E family transporter n=1 Tax=Pontibacter TaxID=323449 RepID=UPI00164ED9BE|nr:MULTISPECIES: AI-2E family transporter [Pontibacter]MBC5775109.1 AI-2E family transporter [Pontibacter sp. KCTC 32443]